MFECLTSTMLLIVVKQTVLNTACLPLAAFISRQSECAVLCCAALQVRRDVRTQSGSAGRLAALEDKLSVLEGAVVGAGEQGSSSSSCWSWPRDRPRPRKTSPCLLAVLSNSTCQ